ncbi:hypothetical protein A3J61_01985 [Candidatus Nomurabacteria bacterium RIFCSPHIGHO2_02_FULL_38_15]|uniref:Orotidine 5'-phosphate decarboxylase domain-containing protein n=1 Tax=Candidatus Nomurabacteria bacterium RIFCSPHIGHO2_02_FULL_38_15 TaxID=1801752 RepID=A0A1F6VRB2_9BACT|nr:MAG: hypothetical protein A3J61_01985 [Candidatus Nomurabacteria bacterium RIFCSPHIGHO2_02_FULL_38_15]
MKNQKKLFLVALHVESTKQSFDEAKKIFAGGADGVLLVNNGFMVFAKDLFSVAEAIKKQYANWIVGINPLDIEAGDAVRMFGEHGKNLDTLWVDDGGIIEGSDVMILNRYVDTYLKLLNQKQQYYGSIDFKYKQPAKDLVAVSKLAAEKFGVVITSGPATGKEPDLQKIMTIKQAIGDTPLGIASGMSTDNIGLFLPYADIFIVGTSLLVDHSDQFFYDQEKIEKFRARIDDYEGELIAQV